MMKTIVLIAGLLFLILNIVAGLILNGYNNFNDGLVAFSIVTTTLSIYLLFNIRYDDLSRKFVTFILVLIGVLKILFSLFSIASFRDNYSILWILGLIFIEIIILLVNYYNKKEVSQ